MGTCEDRDGLHVYKGKAVYAVRGYPAECMECGATISYASDRDNPTHFSPLPPYEPIDWTDENQWLFLNGAMKMETMTRAEFERRYPGHPLPEADDTGK